MPVLTQGSRGAGVLALQNQLIALGFLAGAADSDFGPLTAQAVRDVQRRLLLLPDAVVGPRTSAALAAAMARQPPSPTSSFRMLVQQVQAEADLERTCEDPFPFLDRGIAGSPFRNHLPNYAARLASAAQASQLVPYPDRAGRFSAYPTNGVVPQIVSGSGGRGGLEFLSDAVSQACVCVGSFASDQSLRVRWFGRRALDDNVQFWSATKFVAALHVVCQANRRSPGTPIRSTRVCAGDGSSSRAFDALFTDMVSYAHDHSGPSANYSSNAIGYMFKQLLNSGEPDVQTWLRNLSGNSGLTLLGRYGAPPVYAGAELVGPAGVLVGHGEKLINRNLVSAYDLVRMISMLGWHHQLPVSSRLPGAQWTSLATLVEGLGHDTARYLDVALERLGLLGFLGEPVILSKMGYGLDPGPGISAFNYVAFASFRDTRTSPARQRCFALALRIPTSCATELFDDARMAAEITEIVGRIFAEELS